MLPIGEKLSIATCYASLGDAYLELKQYDESRRWVLESQKIRLDIQDKPGLAYNYKVLVQLELALDDIRGAKVWHNQLLALITPDYSPLFIQIDVLFVAYLIFNHEGDYEKALMLIAVVYNDRVKRNPNVDGLDKRIAELREKLGERYEAIRAQADQETVTSMIEKLQNAYKFIL